MQYTRFVIQAAQILSQTEADSNDLDAELLHQAQSILTRLRNTTLGVVHPVPENPWLAVGLGHYGGTIYGMETSRSNLIDPFLQRERAKTFCIGFLDETESSGHGYLVLPGTPGLDESDYVVSIRMSKMIYEMGLPEKKRDKRPAIEKFAEEKALVDAIWSARPAVVCDVRNTKPISPFAPDDGVWSPFADCFAVAMMLRPERLV